MIGLIAFANNGGIGIQTKRLYEMLKPMKVMIVDSTGFSMNKQLNLDWYPEGSMVTDGFPRNCDINEWLDGVSTVICVENPYNFYLIHACRERGIKIIVQTNYEFCENVFAQHLPVPDLFLMPSYWKLEEMKEMFPDKVVYLPPPIDPKEFHDVYWSMTNRKFMQDYQRPSFLHIVGTLAFEDRNGTMDLLRAVQKCKGKFFLTIHSQHKLPDRYIIDDTRVKYRIKSFENIDDIYVGFDGLINPRRYGGLCLTTNEALMSGIPVMMTDISPNNQLLPKDWLTPVASKKDIFVRSKLDCYTSDIWALAKKIDEWAKNLPDKDVAHKIGMDNFSTGVLESKYRAIL